LINNLSDPTFIFIKDIFKKRKWDKLIEWAHALYVEVIRKFYVNYKPFNLDDHSITSTIRGQTLELTPVVIRKLYKLLKITHLDFSYQGIGAPLKNQMSDLFVDPKGSKWSVKDLFNSVWMLNKYINVLLVKIRSRIGVKWKRRQECTQRM
jgi:hypothetical protein